MKKIQKIYEEGP